MKTTIFLNTGLLIVCFNSYYRPVNAEIQEKVQSVTLEGLVICKPAVKNIETWTAGGSEYCVLDVGEATVEQRTAEEGVILQPSSEVEKSLFFDYQGQRVQVTGKYIEGQSYTPESVFESYPTAMNGQPLPVGAGFQVQTITVLEGV